MKDNQSMWKVIDADGATRTAVVEVNEDGTVHVAPEILFGLLARAGYVRVTEDEISYHDLKERLAAAVRMLGPDEMTPQATKVLNSILEGQT